MPTYEYECKKCSYNFEVFQSMSDEPLKICPKCGKEVRRLIFGGTGVIFKGSGFYVTDKAAGKGTKGKGSDTSQSTSTSTTDNASKRSDDSKGGNDSKGNTESARTTNTGGQEKAKPAVQTT